MESMFQIVARESRQKLVTEAELKTLRRLQGEWQKANELARGCGIDAAFNAYLDHQAKLTLAARAGKLHDHQARSREEIEADFLRRGDAAKQLLREITAEAVAIARPIAGKFAEAAHEVAAKIEKAEAATFAEWGVAYQPSALVLALRRLPDQARARVPSSPYAAMAPQQMLPYLDF